MNIASREAVPGGYMVTIEVTGAYTDGSSRFDRIFVADAAVTGKSPAQVLQAVKDSWDDDPVAGIVGQPVVAPPQTKAVMLDKALALYDLWWRAKQTKLEIVARALPAPYVTAITALENATWANYLAALQAWYAAP